MAACCGTRRTAERGRHGFGTDQFLASAFSRGAFSLGAAAQSFQYHVQAWKIFNTAFLVGGWTDVKSTTVWFLMLPYVA